MKYLKTSDIARSAGIHPNTVRMYEAWGLLPLVPRSPSGYRLFSQAHLRQVGLIRAAMKCTLLGRDIRVLTYELIHDSADNRFSEALDKSNRLSQLIERERKQAEAAAEFLEQWAKGSEIPGKEPDLGISAAAKLLDVTVDMLRDWERNGLVSIPRNPENGYRTYGAHELNLLRVIRMLRWSRYSNMAILRVIQHILSGSPGSIKDIIDTPVPDEDRGYLCFTDTLLSTLSIAAKAAAEMTGILQNQLISEM